MKQEDRRTTFSAFKTEKSALLVSTDVAARGLDFPKVRCIIQYDSPGEATEYVHRYLQTYFAWKYLSVQLATIFTSQLFWCILMNVDWYLTF